jgi:uncharacterized membrane protein
MNKRTATAVFVALAVLLVFVTVQPLVPTRSQPFSELGVLGPSETLGGYPSAAVVDQPLLLYGFISNHEGTASYYQLLVKLGNQTTQVNNETAAAAPVIFTYSTILDQNQSAIFPVNLTIGEQGTNLRLIFELWSFDGASSQFTYTGDWNQLVLNVTSSSPVAEG